MSEPAPSPCEPSPSPPRSRRRSPKFASDTELVAALASAATEADAARALGIDARAMRRRLCKHPDLRAEAQQARREALVDALTCARQRWPDVVAMAVRTVFELLESDEPSLRLRAATAVLRLAGDGALPLPPAPAPKALTSEDRLAEALRRIFAQHESGERNGET